MTVCARCVMDSTDPDIHFDKDGVCNHCHDYDSAVKRIRFEREWLPLAKAVERMKRDGRGEEYDCLIGLSGGVDSSLVAVQVAGFGLRPLAFHLANYWDTNTAVANMQKLDSHLGMKVLWKTVDWPEFRDLQLSFLKASVPDLEAPTDHALVSLMYQLADENNIRHVIIGRNLHTESHAVLAWSHGQTDWKYIKSVQEQFGSMQLRNYPHRTRMQEVRYLRGQHWFNLLDHISYNLKSALSLLRKIGYEYYGGKHRESIYTRFVQGYILPRKFGFDKRRMHLSSLVCSGQLGREEALRMLQDAPYEPHDLAEDKHTVLSRLGLSEGEFERLMSLPNRCIFDYPSYARDDRRLVNRLARKSYRLYRTCRRRLGSY